MPQSKNILAEKTEIAMLPHESLLQLTYLTYRLVFHGDAPCEGIPWKYCLSFQDRMLHHDRESLISESSLCRQMEIEKN